MIQHQIQKKYVCNINNYSNWVENINSKNIEQIKNYLVDKLDNKNYSGDENTKIGDYVLNESDESAGDEHLFEAEENDENIQLYNNVIETISDTDSDK